MKRLALGALGVLLLSPLNLAVFRLLPQDNAFPLGVVVVMDALGILLAIRWLPSAGMAVVLACVVNVPLLRWVGVPEAGEWAGLFALPKLFFFLVAGWWSWSQRRDQSRALRWAGALVPTACCTYVVVFGLVG
ncbi:hypothetical protein [Anaeromyxobacter sp. PSR-1]|uniref:hypothetical protein n=1 Tax=Anaeromyxobacter sp. PSR-1 TaxID=1300915 RepID=UPI00075094F5|nr:hypothetical protein [Anaeromyxobacter sp. PSR-1]